MKEFKFRALTIDKGRFAIGLPVYLTEIAREDEEPNGIIETYSGLVVEIIPDTLEIYTGIKNKKGVEIFGGDVFRQEEEKDEGDVRTYHVVTWIRQRAAFYLIPAAHYPILRDNDCSEEPEFSWLFEEASLYDFSLDIELPLVGNIYKNPELLTK